MTPEFIKSKVFKVSKVKIAIFIFLATFGFINFLLLTFNSREAHAATFNEATIRIDRQQAQTQTTGLICASPASAGVENSVRIKFPTSFTVSTNLSSWTVTTDNIPTSATAWPGVTTATGISGQIVTFPSSDLTTSTLYCFRWSESDALKTGPVGQESEGASITTRTVGGTTIDSTAITISSVANDSISVTANVEPLAGSADLILEAGPDAAHTYSHHQEFTVNIFYRHAHQESFPMAIVGEWEQGIIDGSGNSIDILEYVVGSAEEAVDGTKPIVDPLNRRITWYLPAVPPSSEYKNVTFKLNVKGVIPTDNLITVKIIGKGSIVNSILPESTVTYKIKRVFPPPTPTPTPIPGSQIPLTISSVNLDEITDSKIALSFLTNKLATYVINYGEDSELLNQRVVSLNEQTRHNTELTNLTPNTQYYFRITARDQFDNTVVSDLFTATTASDSDTIKLARDSFTIHWGKYFLISDLINTVVLPKNKPVTITAKINDSTKISNIKAIFQNNEVLGLNNIEKSANIGETPLIEILPGVFSGEILSPEQKGSYSIILETNDINGGFSRKEAPFVFYVSDPLRVVDKKNGRPIENAEVKITKFQESLKLFAPLENSFAITSHTDDYGELDIVLPTGMYEFEIKSPLYKTLNQKLELGISTLDYPLFELENASSLQRIGTYYQSSLSDLRTFTSLTAGALFSSQRARDLYLIFIFFILFGLIVLDTHIKKRVGLMKKLITVSILDVFVFFSGLSTLLFIIYLGASSSALLIAVTIFIFIFTFIYIRRAFFRKRK